MLRNDDPFVSPLTLTVFGNPREIRPLPGFREKHHWPIQVPSRWMAGRICYRLNLRTAAPLAKQWRSFHATSRQKSVGLGAPD
jgi:hypothetical protein